MRPSAEAALAALIVIGFPVWDLISMGRLRAHSTHQTRLRLYSWIFIVEWAATFLALLSTWSAHRASAFAPYAGEVPEFVQTLPISQRDLRLFAGVFVSAILVPVLFAALSPALAARVRLLLKPLAFLLPQGTKERWLFAAVALTAGICEEVLSRGFLLHVLREIPALTMRPAWTAALAVLAFGIAHL